MSFKVEQLEALITQLSADVETQKEVTRLPLKISSEIFLHCLPPRPEPGPRTAPMLLVNVCNSWTDIAISTSALWAAIHLDCQGVGALQNWLQRAGHCGLSISLRESLNDDVAAILRQYARQIQNLELYKPDISFLTTISFFRLTTLIIAFPRTDPSSIIGCEHIMALLHLTSNLQKCNFLNVDVQMQENPPDSLTLHSLRSLKFGDAESGIIHGGQVILRYLTLPCVESLAVPMIQFSRHEFTLFLKRSSPPLRRLVLNSGWADIMFIDLHEIISLLPSLVDLGLHTGSSPFTNDLLSSLADSPLLPKLRSLKIVHQEVFVRFPPLLHQNMLRMLSARRSQITCFIYKALSGDEHKPHAGVCDALRQLAADGMEIFVGSQDQGNYI
ncbi:hypothetical protein MVEN_02045800 [Mycena venus]|uniref:F-box domain-containing protein n=1 Tax=Mycena venus TaxID=2733690 RepID=A0A8H6XBV4_9AGAR|nr:hypothetical protein MVEN_02045800 [Mycena venus]